VGDQDELIEEDWVPTGIQSISTHQYRDGEKLVTKQRILEEYETGVEAYYKNPGLRENYGINEGFENDDNIKSARSNQIEEHLRVKL
jgi:hypothetical protein